ncbi:uncharacterized protein LOC107633817 [Arachis ipaensis]|uniref:uncharacterized protein LOC107633817 n=1 Tax=Arachis ipaensis TaxID=130454 RepID=UPI0007AF7AD6|nr:uncharacterized protein LOC107633817 [Arachis ipaensis]
MPKKPRYICISNAGTDKNQHINTGTEHVAEPAQKEAVPRNKSNGRKDTDYWNVIVSDDGITRTMSLSVKEAIVLPSSRKIILEFNKELQPIGQAAGLLSGFLGNLGADFQHFPISEDSWKTMDKALKEHAYETIKCTFRYEEDDKGTIKRVMIQRLGKIWKEERNHLFHKVYDEEESYEVNAKRNPSGIDAQQWRWFLYYRLKESTKTKFSKSVEATIYTYWGSKTTARLRDEEEKKQQRRISRGEMFIMTHRKRDSSYMNDDARVVGEAIASIESQGGTSKEISVTDSLAQVLGKEHSGRVRGLGFGPCPSEIIRNTPQSNPRVQIEEYQRKITELKEVAAEQKAEITELKAAAAEHKAAATEHKAEAAEDKAKIQIMENLVKYII